MPRKWYTSKITKKVQEAPNTYRFWLEYPDSEDFSFTPGQFITCDLPVGEKRLDRWRSYSIANIPNKEEGIELCIVFLEGGRASDYFKQLQVGEEITFKGPEGQFILKPESSNDLIFICTGTGIAPFRSMILDRAAKDSGPNITLIFGTRFKDGILYHEELKQLLKEPWFDYKIALSREEYLDYKGYVHGLYKDHAQNDTSCHFYLCGWSQMVDHAKDELINTYQIEPSRLHLELYG